MVSDLRSKRSRRAPEARREALLRAAAARFDAADVGSIRMADVAVDAGVAKGTVFLHFSTKEALFLALCEEELFAWLDVLDERLRAMGPTTATAVAVALTETLLPRRRLCRLLSILAAVLERNVDLELIVGWKGRLGARLLVTGARLEGCLLFLPAGQGARLLFRVDAVVIGLMQLADPGPTALLALARPELAPLAVSFDDELGPTLHALLTGLEASASSSSSGTPSSSSPSPQDLP